MKAMSVIQSISFDKDFVKLFLKTVSSINFREEKLENLGSVLILHCFKQKEFLGKAL